MLWRVEFRVFRICYLPKLYNDFSLLANNSEDLTIPTPKHRAWNIRHCNMCMFFQRACFILWPWLIVQSRSTVPQHSCLVLRLRRITCCGQFANLFAVEVALSTLLMRLCVFYIRLHWSGAYRCLNKEKPTKIGLVCAHGGLCRNTELNDWCIYSTAKYGFR